MPSEMTDSPSGQAAAVERRPGKRERLIAAASRLLHQQGVERTTLADIAKAADVPAGNVYYYFKAKDDVVGAVIEAHVQQIKAILAAIEARHRSPKSRLKAFVREFTAQSEIALTTGTTPKDIVRGPDGNLWFTESGRNNIGRLSPNSFSVTGEFPTTTPNSAPWSITVGQDGALWFTENGQDRIGRITTGGTVTEFASPVTGLALQGIGTAPDGSLWFCEPGSGANPGRVGKLVY